MHAFRHCRKNVLAWGFAVVGWLVSLTALAGAPIIDVVEVKAALARGAIVWDVRPTPLYRKGHIPGAINIGDAGTVLRNPVTEDFIDTPQIEKIFGEAGLDPRKEIVVYAERGSAYAYFGRFALRYFGAGNVSVFHDGIEGWEAAGGALEQTDSRLPALTVRLTEQPQLAVATEEMMRVAKWGGAQILDVRTTGEHVGNDVRAIRGGAIPGAVNIPYEENWQDPETPAKLARRQVANNGGQSLAATERLKALYAKLDPDKETIVYCQSGVRAAETATVLESLGFRNVKIYDASWLGYAARLDAPAANERFFNVGALNGRLASMQRRIDELEKMIAQLHNSHSAADTKR
jgi:thiosulfate/3-mercaptopyruvate sulfurtransferase